MIDNFQGEHFFLSNFYPQVISYRGKFYPTAEHAYQAAKMTNEADVEAVRCARTAGAAKRLGRRLTMAKGFEYKKVDVMREILKVKFALPALRAQLLATGDQELVEGNTWGDTYWGRVDGRGQNWLGKLLMEIRAAG